MENLFEQTILKYFSPKELEALAIIKKGFGITSIDDFAEKVFEYDKEMGNLQKDNAELNEIKSMISDNNIIKKIGQLGFDKDVLNNSQLPIRETLVKVIRLVVIKMFYPSMGYDIAANFIEKTAEEVLTALIIEGDSNRGTINLLDSLLSEIKEIAERNKLFDWPYPELKLEELSKFLTDNRYIEESQKVINCFKKENPTKEDKITWKKGITDLVYLSYRLWNKYYPDKTHLTACRRFTLDKKELDPNILRRTYNNIQDECRHNDVIPRRYNMKEFLKNLLD